MQGERNALVPRGTWELSFSVALIYWWLVNPTKGQVPTKGQDTQSNHQTVRYGSAPASGKSATEFYGYNLCLQKHWWFLMTLMEWEVKVLEQDVTSAFHTLSQVKTKPTQKSLRCEYNHRLQIKSVKVDCQLCTSDILLCNYPLEILMFKLF